MPRPENVIGKGNRFKKGQSGNPKGRPKLPDIKVLLEEVLGEQKDGMTAAEALMKKLRSMGAAGNLKAIEMLLDRAYGKPKQVIDTNIVSIPQFKVVNPDDADELKKLYEGDNITDE